MPDGTFPVSCLSLTQEFFSAKRPMVVVGSEVLQRSDAAAIHRAVTAIASGVGRPTETEWRVLNVLHRVRRGGLCTTLSLDCCLVFT